MARITFVQEDGTTTVADAPIGCSVMAATKAYSFALEAACGGAMACATCHVKLPEAWRGRVPPPSEEEETVLDVVFGVTEASRLACQIVMTEALDGIEVHLPAPLSAPL